MSSGASLEAQWLRIWLAMQGTWVSIPGRGTKILHVAEQLSRRKAAREPVSYRERSHTRQQSLDQPNKCMDILKNKCSEL